MRCTLLCYIAENIRNNWHLLSAGLLREAPPPASSRISFSSATTPMKNICTRGNSNMPFVITAATWQKQTFPVAVNIIWSHILALTQCCNKFTDLSLVNVGRTKHELKMRLAEHKHAITRNPHLFVYRSCSSILKNVIFLSIKIFLRHVPIYFSTLKYLKSTWTTVLSLSLCWWAFCSPLHLLVLPACSYQVDRYLCWACDSFFD